MGLTPDVLALLDRLSMPSRRRLLGSVAGQRPSPRPGTSPELADFRPYVAGDDFRRVDWNAYARLERLLLRLYVGEEDVCVTTWVDVSASMAGGAGGPVKERAARGLAGAVAYLALSGYDRAACVGFAGTVAARAGPFRGRAAAPRCWDALAQLPTGGPTSWSAVAGAARSVPRGISVVVSDFLTEESPVPAVAALRQAGHDVMAIQVLSPAEREPDLRGDLALTDVETGARVEVTASAPVVAGYRSALAAHQAGLARMAAAHGAAWVSLDGGLPLFDLVVALLGGRAR